MNHKLRKKYLLDAEKRIRKFFLNFKARPTGNYTPRQLRLAESYVLHVHAEIECYFEDMISFALVRAEQKWALDKTPTRLLIYLASFNGNRKERVSRVPNNDIWEERIRKAISHQKTAVKSNHGIKTKNLVRMYAPAGFDVRKIDVLLFSELDSFGVLRGGYAHSSMSARAGVTFDPFHFPAQAARLFKLIETFDGDACAFIESIS
jgi:hypothetical protein